MALATLLGTADASGAGFLCNRTDRASGRPASPQPKSPALPYVRCNLASCPDRQTKSAKGDPVAHTSLSSSRTVVTSKRPITKQKAAGDAAILGGSSGGSGGNSGSGGGGGGGSGSEGSSSENSDGLFGALAATVTRGWRQRVEADPEFVFKVLTEQVIGVTACVLGDMASRPNFGLNELDFVFSTLVVGSILNFALMYLLAPVAAPGSAAAAAAVGLPGIFASCPAGHMFEPGNFSALQRAGTFVYKGLQFGIVGFAAGLAGTLLSNVLLEIRLRMQPDFVLQNAPPPLLLNAGTWMAHMGVSSNLRYQCLNGLDLALVKVLPPGVFRSLVFVIRGLNNVVGGSTFAMLAKFTGAQKSAGGTTGGEEKEKTS